jgi:hypothetical protein
VSLENTERLDKFFRDNHFPSAAQKSQLAEQMGLEVQQVSTWFVNRRKKARAAEQATAQEGTAHQPVILDADEAIVLNDAEAADPTRSVATAAAVDGDEPMDASTEPAHEPEAAAVPNIPLPAAQDPACAQSMASDEALVAVREETRALEERVRECQSLVLLDPHLKGAALNRTQVHGNSTL